jgi:hypothetical protein
MKDRMAETIRSKLSPNNGKGYIYVENEDDKSLQLSTARKEARMPDPILSADDDVLSIEKLLPKLGISIGDLRKMIKQKDSMDMKPPPIENIASHGSTAGVSTLSSLSGTPSIASTTPMTTPLTPKVIRQARLAASAAGSVASFDPEEDIFKEELFPVVKKHNISMKNNGDISKVLNEICTLLNHVQSTNLLQFQQKNDLKTTLVCVPQSSNELSFRRNVNRTKCVDKILDAFIPSTKKESVQLDDDEDAITDQDDVVYCLLRYLGTKYADQFALAAKDLGLPVHKKEKIPPARVAAMMEEANLGSKARIVVAKHFNAWYGWNFLPPRI